jgi:hypothetical protein
MRSGREAAVTVILNDVFTAGIAENVENKHVFVLSYRILPLRTLLAAHRAAYLAGESPAAVIGCLPHSYNRRLSGVTRQAKARS